MNDRTDPRAVWSGLAAFSETFTCYSAALATWVAWADEDWRPTVNPGLWLVVGEQPEGLFSFSYFPPRLRAAVDLGRTGLDEPDQEAAVSSVLEVLRSEGRVIVAGDGFNLPWHAAFQRRHMPHWYVLVEAEGEIAVMDPFAFRNELGVQTATREPLSREALGPLLRALPPGDAVFRLRESFALGDRTPTCGLGYQWFASGVTEERTAPAGLHGPAAMMRLARHFREHGQQPEAYAQVDDIWSIARHRAFLCRAAEEDCHRTGDARLARWVAEHAAPLAKRWSHISPLMMQATLALNAGRSASTSVPDALESLAGLEEAAAASLQDQSIWHYAQEGDQG